MAKAVKQTVSSSSSCLCCWFTEEGASANMVCLVFCLLCINLTKRAVVTVMMMTGSVAAMNAVIAKKISLNFWPNVYLESRSTYCAPLSQSNLTTWKCNFQSWKSWNILLHNEEKTKQKCCLSQDQKQRQRSWDQPVQKSTSMIPSVEVSSLCKKWPPWPF